MSCDRPGETACSARFTRRLHHPVGLAVLRSNEYDCEMVPVGNPEARVTFESRRKAGRTLQKHEVRAGKIWILLPIFGIDGVHGPGNQLVVVGVAAWVDRNRMLAQIKDQEAAPVEAVVHR